MRLRRVVIALTGLALAAPAQAFAAEFDPSDEFELKPWISIHLGPLDMSINKAVVYLLISAVLTCALGTSLYVVYLLEIVKLANPFIRRREAQERVATKSRALG